MPAFALHDYWKDDLVIITGRGKHSNASEGSPVKLAVEERLRAAGLSEGSGFGPDELHNPGRVVVSSEDLARRILPIVEEGTKPRQY